MKLHFENNELTKLLSDVGLIPVNTQVIGISRATSGLIIHLKLKGEKNGTNKN